MSANIAFPANDLQGNFEASSHQPPALIVAGPTCSGKSTLALALARRLGGTVINADAMQVYRELEILTARPSPADLAAVPHALYGVRPAAEAGDAAWWRGAALAAMEDAARQGRIPILCGGTGLYLAALTQGIAALPPPGAARAEARALLATLGPAGLHARLATVDPDAAARLAPTDSQRIARAWEVFSSTGRSIVAWQNAPALPPAPWRFLVVQLDPPREVLREAIATRFNSMLADGALEEVRALLALDLDPALPAMRAHGVPELAAHLLGSLALAEAESRAVIATGQYTKRQATWFRHRKLAAATDTHTIHARISDMQQYYERIDASLAQFLSRRIDAPGPPP